MIEHYKRNPNSSCAVCGKPIYKRPAELNRNKGRVFCSMACYGISCRKETPCSVCGKAILAGLNKKTCSRVCANIARTGISYTGRRLKDKVVGARAIKIRLVEARGARCERCGYNRVEIIQVHHKDRDRNNNELGNLELLCPNCHYEEHHSDVKDALGV